MQYLLLYMVFMKCRVPVFERRIDNIVGIAYAMDMLDYVEQVRSLVKDLQIFGRKPR